MNLTRFANWVCQRRLVRRGQNRGTALHGAVVLGIWMSGLSACTAEKGLEFELGGKRQTILPLDYSTRQVVALSRNGTLLQLRPQQLQQAKLISRFRPFSQAEARGELLREFGKAYEVTGTGHYLVVHPKGTRDLWVARFEELYRSMMHFFRARNYPLSKPQFPLVSIVFPSASHYEQYAARALRANVQNTYGAYMPRTNRIYLYDSTIRRGSSSGERANNLATIMHESAHQTAFNVGIHRRAATDPSWLVEGLGCLFEARGIYDPRNHANVIDRINRERLLDYRKFISQDAETVFASIVTSEKLFRRNPARAYAAAWALTFYLAEREPQKYIRLLKRVASLAPFQTYGADARLRDFTEICGGNFPMLGVRVNRFIDTLPTPVAATP